MSVDFVNTYCVATFLWTLQTVNIHEKLNSRA